MKRLTCLFLSLALVIGMSLPARAAFTGVLRGDQDWMLVVANNSSNPTGVTAYFLDRGVNVELTDTLPPGGTLIRTISKIPSRVKRIIIEVDPGLNGSFPGGATVTITQGATSYALDCQADHCRLLLDVE